MCNKAPYNPANIVICFPQNHNRKIIKNVLPSYYFIARFKATDCNNVSSCSASGTFHYKKNADQIEQFLFCRFLILPAVFPAVLTCDIPAGVLHHEPVGIRRTSCCRGNPCGHTLPPPAAADQMPSGNNTTASAAVPALPAAPPYFFPIRAVPQKRLRPLHRISLIGISSIFIHSILIHACFISFLLFLIPYAHRRHSAVFQISNTISLAKTAVPY